jgi:hypothetical protein
MKLRTLTCFLSLLALGLAGCSTGDTSASPSASQPKATRASKLTPEELAKLPPVVIVSIDSNYDAPNVIVNGFNVGYAPRDIYLEVNEDGTLPYAVTISVDPSGHSDARAAAMLESSRGPRLLTKSYPAGRVPPRKIFFDPVATREDGQATQRAKPGTSPTARRDEAP